MGVNKIIIKPLKIPNHSISTLHLIGQCSHLTEQHFHTSILSHSVGWEIPVSSRNRLPIMLLLICCV